jgi:phosphatidylglycerol:prolipoprotein diacylglycerol transferase
MYSGDETGAWYLILYSIGRFVIEMFRGDEIRGNVGILSTSQFIALFIFGAGCALWFLAPRLQKAEE